MTPRYLIIAGTLALALGACASNNSSRIDASLPGDELAAAAKQAEDEGREVVICRRERTTGSHRAKKRCVSYQTYKDEQEQSRKNMSKFQQSNAQRGGGN